MFFKKYTSPPFSSKSQILHFFGYLKLGVQTVTLYIHIRTYLVQSNKLVF
jgi:VanZ family protein